MITRLHAMFWSDEAEQLRAFLRDKIQLPYTDVGEGWLIFSGPPSEIGVHPTGQGPGPRSGAHEVSFVTDDLDAEIAAWKQRGVVFDDEVVDQGYGRVIHFTMPGGVKAELYQPHYTMGV